MNEHHGGVQKGGENDHKQELGPGWGAGNVTFGDHAAHFHLDPRVTVMWDFPLENTALGLCGERQKENKVGAKNVQSRGEMVKMTDVETSNIFERYLKIRKSKACTKKAGSNNILFVMRTLLLHS